MVNLKDSHYSTFFGIDLLWNWNEIDLFESLATAEFSRFVDILNTILSMFLCNIVLYNIRLSPLGHIQNWVFFPLWLSHFILSGDISNCSPLFPSSILDTFWLGVIIFYCHIFLPFHTVHGILTARILEW